MRCAHAAKLLTSTQIFSLSAVPNTFCSSSLLASTPCMPGVSGWEVLRGIPKPRTLQHAPWTRWCRQLCSAKRCRGPFHWTEQTVSAREGAAAAHSAAHLVSPCHNSVAIASHLKAQPLRLQPDHCDVCEPLLTCAERQAQCTRRTCQHSDRARTDGLLKGHAASCTADNKPTHGTRSAGRRCQVYRSVNRKHMPHRTVLRFAQE